MSYHPVTAGFLSFFPNITYHYLLHYVSNAAHAAGSDRPVGSELSVGIDASREIFNYLIFFLFKISPREGRISVLFQRLKSNCLLLVRQYLII